MIVFCKWKVCIIFGFSISEKDDEEGEKREEPRDNSEELGGGMDKSSGPWNRSAPTQAPVAEIIGKFCVIYLSVKECLNWYARLCMFAV